MNLGVIEMPEEQAEKLFSGGKWMHFAWGPATRCTQYVIVDPDGRLLGAAEGSAVERHEYTLADLDFFANAACLPVSRVRRLLVDPHVTLLRLSNAVDLRKVEK